MPHRTPMPRLMMVDTGGNHEGGSGVTAPCRHTDGRDRQGRMGWTDTSKRVVLRGRWMREGGGDQRRALGGQTHAAGNAE